MHIGNEYQKEIVKPSFQTFILSNNTSMKRTNIICASAMQPEKKQYVVLVEKKILKKSLVKKSNF